VQYYFILIFLSSILFLEASDPSNEPFPYREVYSTIESINLLPESDTPEDPNFFQYQAHGISVFPVSDGVPNTEYSHPEPPYPQPNITNTFLSGHKRPPHQIPQDSGAVRKIIKVNQQKSVHNGRNVARKETIKISPIFFALEDSIVQSFNPDTFAHENRSIAQLYFVGDKISQLHITKIFGPIFDKRLSRTQNLEYIEFYGVNLSSFTFSIPDLLDHCPNIKSILMDNCLHEISSGTSPLIKSIVRDVCREDSKLEQLILIDPCLSEEIVTYMVKYVYKHLCHRGTLPFPERFLSSLQYLGLSFDLSNLPGSFMEMICQGFERGGFARGIGFYNVKRENAIEYLRDLYTLANSHYVLTETPRFLVFSPLETRTFVETRKSRLLKR
jgi:hypothetical protein